MYYRAEGDNKVHAAGQRQKRSETPLESIRRFSTYEQLLESYQFVNSHPNMASVLILLGIGLPLPCVIYYICYYANYLANIYCTVVPSLYTLVNMKQVNQVNMELFKPPWYNFLLCVLNAVSGLMSLICAVLSFYLILPVKGRYLATILQKLERRRRHCLTIAAILTVSIPFQIFLSMQRSIRILRLDIDAQHRQLLSAEAIRTAISEQGITSFWSLHAYENLPCCFNGFISKSSFGWPIPSDLPGECCQTYGKAPNQTWDCVTSADSRLLWPDCAAAVVNIVGDMEVTLDAQMQLALIFSCVVAFIMKYALLPHLRMQCGKCQHTYGWVDLKRYDN